MICKRRPKQGKTCGQTKDNYLHRYLSLHRLFNSCSLYSFLLIFIIFHPPRYPFCRSWLQGCCEFRSWPTIFFFAMPVHKIASCGLDSLFRKNTCFDVTIRFLRYSRTIDSFFEAMVFFSFPQRIQTVESCTIVH
jgi:hypothetical protein